MKARVACITMFALLLLPVVAWAVPGLQLYMENSTYDSDSETWTTLDNPLTLQVLGATTPSWVHYIDQVTLYVSVSEEDYNTAGSISIQGLPSGAPTPDEIPLFSELLGAGGLAPVYGIPQMPVAEPGDDPKDLPTHDVYPTYYWAVPLPNLMVEVAGEVVLNYNPGETGSDLGDIQNYQVAYSNFSGVHFDLAGVAHNGHSKSEFAPFSHDAEAFGNGEPNGYIAEPATLLLLGSGLVGLALKRKRRRKT